MPDGGMRLAIDLGGTKIAAALIKDGKVLERRQIDTPRQQVESRLCPAIHALAGDFLGRSSGTIGVATTGFAVNGKVSATNPATMPFPEGFDLAGLLRLETGRAVIVINDAQAAAFGEFAAGAGRSFSQFAFVTVSTGVGGGIVADGRLMQGPGGFAGHIGHMVVSQNGPTCGCGRKGCVEAIASGAALAETASQLLGYSCSTAEAIERAEKGEPAFEELVNDAAKAIGTLAANLKATLDIEAIVMGGGVGLNPAFHRRVKKAIGEQPGLFQVPLLAAECGADAGLIGVAELTS